MSLMIFQSLHFPAITICGMNALRLNEVNESRSLRNESVIRSLLNSKFHFLLLFV